MINFSELSFYLSVKYTSKKNYKRDYTLNPIPYHNFVFMLEGEGTITLENSTIQMKKGDILFIPKSSRYVSSWKANPVCIFHPSILIFLQIRTPFFLKAYPCNFYQT